MLLTKDECDSATLPGSEHHKCTMETVDERTAALAMSVVGHGRVALYAFGIINRETGVTIDLMILRHENGDRNGKAALDRHVLHSAMSIGRCRTVREGDGKGRRDNQVLRTLLNQRKSKGLSELVADLESLILELLAKMMSASLTLPIWHCDHRAMGVRLEVEGRVGVANMSSGKAGNVVLTRDNDHSDGAGLCEGHYRR